MAIHDTHSTVRKTRQIIKRSDSHKTITIKSVKMISEKKDKAIPTGSEITILDDSGYFFEPFCDREYIKIKFNSYEGYIPRESIGLKSCFMNNGF